MIVGDGPPRPELEQAVSELGLDRQVVFTGYQPFHDLPKYINLSTICINPVPVNETTQDLFSAKVIQYLACGKPAISTPLRGITTLLTGESHGMVYADTAADMAGEVIALLKSPERRHKLGQAGLNYVRQAHSCDAVIRQFETYLTEVISNHQREKGGQTNRVQE